MRYNLILYKLKNTKLYLNNNININNTNDVVSYNYNKDTYDTIINKIDKNKNYNNIFILSDLTEDNYFKLTYNNEKIYNNNINLDNWNKFSNFLNSIISEVTNNVYLFVSLNYSNMNQIQMYLYNNIKYLNCNINFINYNNIDILNNILNSDKLEEIIHSYYNIYSLNKIFSINDNNTTKLYLNNIKTELTSENKINIVPNDTYNYSRAKKYIYTKIYNNNYSFCGIEEKENKLVAWGNKSYGGYIPYVMTQVTEVIPTPMFYIAFNSDNHCIIWGSIMTYFKDIISYTNVNNWHIIEDKTNIYNIFQNDSNSIIQKNIINQEVINLLVYIRQNKDEFIILIKKVLIKRIYEKILSKTI
jgi:hypothetical protein